MEKHCLELWELNPWLRTSGHMFWIWNNREPGIAYDNRIFVVIGGEASLILGRDEEEFILQSGSAVFFGAGVPYKFKNIDPGKPFEFYCVSYDMTCETRGKSPMQLPDKLSHFDPQKLTDRLTVTGEHDLSSLGFPIILGQSGKIASICADIWREFNSKRPYYPEVCSSLIKSALCEAMRLREEKLPARNIPRINDPDEISRDNSLASRVMRCIENNYKRPVTESDIAAIMNYHPYYLARVVSRAYGTTPYKYLMQCRAEEAVRLLTTTKTPIGEIAKACGFVNSSHFSTVIRRMTGKRPTDFRGGVGYML